MATETSVLDKEEKKAQDKSQRDKEHKEVFGKLSEEELSKQQDEFLEAFYPTKKPEAKKQESTKEEKTEKKDEEKPAEEKKEETAKETKTEEDPEKAKETEKKAETKAEKKKGRGLLQETPVEQVELEPEPVVIEEEVPKKPEPKAQRETEIEDFDEDDQEELAAVDWLAKNDPKFQGRDLQAELKKHWNREEAYIAKWEKNNPGEKFVVDAPEHAEFYRQQPIGARDLQRALKGLDEQRLEDRVARRIEERIAPEVNEAKVRDRYREAKPLIERAASSALAELAVRGVPEFADLIPEGEHGRTITEDLYGKLSEQNPFAVEILDTEAAILQVQIQELETLRHLGDVVQPNREKRVPVDGRIIMPVADIAQAGVELERRIQSQPEADREFEGKKFVPRAVLNERVNSIINGEGSDQQKRAKINALYKKYWTIGADEIRELLINKSAGRVKRLVERLPKPEQKNGHKSGLPSTEADRTTDKQTTKTPPSTASASDQVDTGLGKGKKTSGIAEEVDRAMGW